MAVNSPAAQASRAELIQAAAHDFQSAKVRGNCKACRVWPLARPACHCAPSVRPTDSLASSPTPRSGRHLHNEGAPTTSSASFNCKVILFAAPNVKVCACRTIKALNAHASARPIPAAGARVGGEFERVIQIIIIFGPLIGLRPARAQPTRARALEQTFE